MKPVRKFVAALSAVAALHAAGAPAMAQVPQLLPPGLIWPSLTASDIDHMHAAAALLYQGRAAGAVERWQNPETQNAGSITLTRSFEMKGMPCRAMTYRIRFKQAEKQHNHYQIDWCQIPDGSWKIVDEEAIH